MDRITDVSSIVDSGQNIDGYEKALLKKLFCKLEENQKDVFDKIEAKVNDQLISLSQKKTNWHISTALIDNDKNTKDQAKRNGYYEIVPLDKNNEVMTFNELNVFKEDDPKVCRRGNVYAGVVFLNCKYGEISGYKKDYYGTVHTNDNNSYKIKYNLIPFEAIMDQEKYLEQTALQYGIDVPLIYSPMSRRAMVIKVDLSVSQAIDNKDNTIDFQYEKNQLNKVLINDKTLVWNVISDDKNFLPRPKENVDKKITAIFDKSYIIYSFDAKENEYYYVQSKELDIRRVNSDIFIGLDNNLKIEDIDYQRFTVCPYNSGGMGNILAFENKFSAEFCVKQRVRTKGDINNILSCFDIECDDIGFSGKHSVIFQYDNRYSYHYPKEDVLKSSSVIYVKIHNSGELYFEDYVSYVFSFLNYYYPEFRWVGVY